MFRSSAEWAVVPQYVGKLFPYDISRVVQDYCDDKEVIVEVRGTYLAKLASGRLITWGRKQNNEEIIDQINSGMNAVRSLHATHKGFVVLLDNGTIVLWGFTSIGRCQEQLNKQITVKLFSSPGVFAAISQNNEVSVWDSKYSSQIQQTKNVHVNSIVTVCGRQSSFIALTCDGELTSWGEDCHDCPITDKDKVKSLHMSSKRLAAHMKNDDVIIWKSSHICGYYNNIKTVHASRSVFVLHQRNDDVIAVQHNGNEMKCTGHGSHVVSVCSTFFSDTILFANGRVQIWGVRSISLLQNMLTNQVQAIYATTDQSAALLKNGHVVIWTKKGHAPCLKVQGLLSNQTRTIHALANSFVAILNNGEKVQWKNLYV